MVRTGFVIEVPDSGIGRTQDIRTYRNSVGWCDQNTFQPTIPQPIKRRTGDRVVTRSDRPCGVPHVSEPFSVRKSKIVSPLGVM